MKVTMSKGKHSKPSASPISFKREASSLHSKQAVSPVPAVVMLVLFAALTACLYCLDLRPIAANNSLVGLGALNGAFHEFTGVNWGIYAASECGGYLAIVSMFVFFGIGVYELVKARSLEGVDKGIYLIAAAYVVMLVLYVFFDKVALNYRPVLVDGQLEPSFPSSHSFLAVGALGCAVVWVRKRMHGSVKNVTCAVCVVVIVLSVLARLVCGVHWLTDIIAGVLLGLALVFAYRYLLDRLDHMDTMPRFNLKDARARLSLTNR